MRHYIALLIILLSGCATTGGGASRSTPADVDDWLNAVALPGLGKTLSEHPRFRNEVINVAVMTGADIQVAPNALGVRLRDNVHSTLLAYPGLDITLTQKPADCLVRPSGYYLSVELQSTETGPSSLQLRLYDIVEQRWVSGFGHRWQGQLNARQRTLAKTITVPEHSRGARVLPFMANQSDLLAAHLAQQLACQLQQSGDDDAIIQPARHRAAALIAGNLASRHNLNVSGHGNLALDTRVHLVDPGLYQVWAILTPAGTGNAGSVVSSAYAAAPLLRNPIGTDPSSRVAGRVATPSATAPRTTIATQRLATLNVAAPHLVSASRVVGPASKRRCRPELGWTGRSRLRDAEPLLVDGDCFAIEFLAEPDTAIFIVAQDSADRLARLYPSQCTPGGLQKQRSGALRFPAVGALGWHPEPGKETLLILAVRTKQAKTQLEKLMQQIPQACGQERTVPVDAAVWRSDLQGFLTRFGQDAGQQRVDVRHTPYATQASRRLGT